MNSGRIGQMPARKPRILFVWLAAFFCNSLIISCFLFEWKTSA
jgi:hypothetical protein